MQELAKLGDLKAKGLITAEEFQKMTGKYTSQDVDGHTVDDET